jgi:dTDP-glucose 4,6-dehydratase
LDQSICRIIDELVPGRSSPRERLITFVEDRPGHDLRYSIDPSPTQQELGWAAEETFDADCDPR